MEFILKALWSPQNQQVAGELGQLAMLPGTRLKNHTAGPGKMAWCHHRCRQYMLLLLPLEMMQLPLPPLPPRIDKWNLGVPSLASEREHLISTAQMVCPSPRCKESSKTRSSDVFSFNSEKWALLLKTGNSPNRIRSFRCWITRTCTSSFQPSHLSLVNIAGANKPSLIHLALGHRSRKVFEAYKLEDHEIDSWGTLRMDILHLAPPCWYSLLLAGWHFSPSKSIE